MSQDRVRLYEMPEEFKFGWVDAFNDAGCGGGAHYRHADRLVAASNTGDLHAHAMRDYLEGYRLGLAQGFARCQPAATPALSRWRMAPG